MKIGDNANPKFGAKNRQAVRPQGLFSPRGLPVEATPELDRILALPRRPQVDMKSMTARAIVLRETAKYKRDRTGMGPCKCRDLNPDQGCITELLPAQAIMLRELSMAGGGIGAIPAGGGKSGIDLLAILALGLKRERREQGLLLVPAPLVTQIIDDYNLWSEHFIMPEVVVHKPGGDWVGYAPSQPVLHIMSHNAISSPRDSDFIDSLQPSSIVIDEIDAFGSRNSSRTMRCDRYMKERGHLTRFCGWTGSIADKSLTEFSHLLAWALKLNSPLPLDDDDVESWARCYDAVDNPCPPGALMRLVEDCDVGNTDIARARAALRRRFSDTLGFVITGTAEVRITGADGKLQDELVQLQITAREVPPIPDIITEALASVRGWERPDTLAGGEWNDPIEDIFIQAKYAREVATGMFYYADFPRGESRELIKEWYGAKSAWFSERREKMYQGERFLDSAKLCENAAKRAWGDMELGGIEEKEVCYTDDDGQEHWETKTIDNRHLPLWKAETWPRWRDLEDQVQPVQKAHRLHPFLVEDAAQWGLERRGIIWYSMIELGEWIAEISGLPQHGGGRTAGEDLLKEIRNNKRSIVASLKSHGRGRNGLQHQFDRQYVINTASSNRIWEQVGARTHRLGQKSPLVTIEVCLHTPELLKSFNQALRRADFSFDLFAQQQRLRMAIPGDAFKSK